ILGMETAAVEALAAEVFFFSSRRRHTRFSRDWSSDVCSSDLHPHELFKGVLVAGTNGKGSVCAMVASVLQSAGYRVGLMPKPHRSEERRVGEERSAGRSRTGRRARRR